MPDFPPVVASPKLLFRVPKQSDARAIHQLVAGCKPLDLNSTYAYLLLCTHFAGTCAVAEEGGEILGFVSGYREPAEPSTLVVWQVAVSPQARGRGLAKAMLNEILSRPECRGVTQLEATVSPTNKPSRNLFESLAREHQAACSWTPLFHAAHFGNELHEEEQLLRISPLRGPARNGGKHENH
jgi:L-2,4-diaminobutyric acid acetyltransferase